MYRHALEHITQREILIFTQMQSSNEVQVNEAEEKIEETRQNRVKKK